MPREIDCPECEGSHKLKTSPYHDNFMLCPYCTNGKIKLYTEKELKELRDIIKTQEDYINKILIKDSDLIEKAINQEIEELKEACNDYKRMYVEKNAEIKKLRDALEVKDEHMNVVIACLDKPQLWDYSEKFVHGYMKSMIDKLKEALEETDA